jgi:hypothetical protein
MITDALSPAAGDLQSPEPGSPDLEALLAMGVAAGVAREMHRQGRELRFSLVRGPERVRIEVCDLDGGVLGGLSATEAIALACGETAPGGRLT